MGSLYQWTEPASERLLDIETVTMLESESRRQIDMWGKQTHDPAEWFLILGEEVGELGQEICKVQFDGRLDDARKLIAEAIQVATLAIKIARMV